MCYFKRSTLEHYIKSHATKIFNSTMDALHYLGCERHAYWEGEKNIWYVQMPEFVSHVGVTPTKKTKKETSELDDEYHTEKFRTPSAKNPPPENS
jgi:transposase